MIFSERKARIDMRHYNSSRVLIRWLSAALVGTLLAGALPANAQEQPKVISPLVVEPDRNGVNLSTGKLAISVPTLSVPAAPRLRFDRVQNSAPYIKGNIKGGGGTATVTAKYSAHTSRASSESFDCDQEIGCKSVTLSGSKLDTNFFSMNLYRATGGGELYTFNLEHVNSSGSETRTVQYYASKVEYPDGETITYSYETAKLAGDTFDRTWYRPKTVSSNVGYHINITYQGDTFDEASIGAWSTAKEAALYKSGTTSPLQLLTYGADGSITDIGGRVHYTSGANNSLGSDLETTSGSAKLPDEASNSLTINKRPNENLIETVVRDGVQWNYHYTNLAFPTGASDWTYTRLTVTGPDSYSIAYDMAAHGLANGFRNIIVKQTDELNRATSFEYDSAYRVNRISLPEGSLIDVGYDDNGNIVRKTTRAKPNTGLADLVETAQYGAIDCVGVLCFRPTWYKDALSRQTDFVHNSHGQLTEQLDPADVGGIRRKTYIQYETAPNGVSRRKVVRVCGTGAGCDTTSEIRTEYDYWGNTLLPSTERRIDAGRGITLTTTYDYDSAGRLTSTDGPLPGTDDATYARYDIHGRRTWEVGPRGANGVRNAKRITYRDSDDKPILIEDGTVADHTSTALDVLTRTDLAYDDRRNPVREAVSSGGTSHSLTHRTFHATGRIECEARRMNPDAFGSLPASACWLGTQGSQGPDRITRNIYDAAGQLLTVQKAYGTAIQQDYVRYGYSLNGKRTGVTDANGNRAELRYDGHDRQVRWVFPSRTSPGSLNEDDYEAYGYDAAGNRTSFRKRDGSTLTFQYDALNRMTAKFVPERSGLSSTHTRDVYYNYDVGNRQLYARFDHHGGEGLSNSYDALGRLTDSTMTMDGVSRPISHQYDAAGNRSRVNHPDGAFMTYEHDPAGRLQLVRENGGDVLASFTYDSSGRRSWLGYAGVATNYGYDGASRLTSLSHDLAGTSRDQSLGFSYNPASQVITRTSSNDAYAWGGHVNVERGYAVNGLNQYTTAGAATFSYDANGNLTSDGSTTYLYDVENRLVSASGASNAQLRYDPLGRLYETNGASGLTRFLYDGDALIGEYDSGGGMPHRYVHGSDLGADDPLIWYANNVSGWRRGLISDHQGSVIAVTDMNGNPIATNSYDEYGIPGSGNQGRFQYTGQAWIPDLGMYHYKARIYSPTLGRFLQTDPIGYEDQINLYAYVGNDPVNKNDPDGREAACITLNTGCLRPNADPFGQMWRFFTGDIKNAWDDPSLKNVLIAAVGVAPAGRALSRGADAIRFGSSVAANTVLARKMLDAARSDAVRSFQKGAGTPIMGHGTAVKLDQAERLAKQYGGSAADYQKVTSAPIAKTSDGRVIEVHAYRNADTGKIYEDKFKVQGR